MYRMIPFASPELAFSRFFDDMERELFPRASHGELTFPADIRDEGEHYLLRADLPGVGKDAIDLEVKDGVLTISAQKEEEKEENLEGRWLYRERRSGSVRRSFDLTGIREEDIRASYENGVLCLVLPKQDQPQSRKIPIE